MQPEQWQRLSELWDEASSLSSAELEAFLDRLGRRDEALRAQLETLLANARDDAFLARPILDVAPPGEDPWRGRRLGPYVLKERIGVGGMSFVYLAERADDEFERRVAVKLLQGFSHPDHERRLLAERQILAQLDHPNIARLYDGGTTQEGVAYVVMELVDGVPITTYRCENDLGLTQTLELFRKVCDAVHYAHRHLVVHRDLKPANILVNAEGEPKLLDFGLAKLLEPESDMDPTRTLYRALTPGYASPEQVAGRPITTASDVYSLGVLLYELLSGVKPFDFADKSPAEIERELTETPPRPPSEVAQPGDAPTAGKRLAGDLDLITLEALRSEPENRYPSAEAFSEDVGRYLAGQPVRARPATWGYRAWKFAGRNRVAVTLSFLLLATTLGFAVNASLQGRRLAEERNLARAEQQRAEEAVVFLEQIFMSQDPRAEGRRSVGAKKLLDDQRTRVETDLADRPELQARLCLTLGSVYQHLGHYQDAHDLFERSLSLRRQVLGQHHPEVGVALGRLGMAWFFLGDVPQALEHLNEGVAVLERSGEGWERPRAQALHSRALVQREAGDLPGAEKSLRRAVALHPARGDSEKARVLSDLATLLQLRGEFEEAEMLTRQALALERAKGASSPILAGILNTLGEVLRNRNAFDEAESALREAVSIYRSRMGDTAETVAALNNLGAVLRARADYTGATGAYQEALERVHRIHGEEHPYIGTILGNLGRLALVVGDLDGAEQHMLDALALYQRLVAPEHPRIALTWHNIARLRRHQGRLEEALETSDRALELLRANVGDDHVWMAAAFIVRGAIFLDLGELDRAATLLEHSLASRTRALGSDGPAVAEAKRSLARLHRLRGQNQRAADLYTESSQLFRANLGAAHPETAATEVLLSDVYRCLGRLEEAHALASTALPALEASLGDGHWTVRSAHHIALAVQAQAGPRSRWEGLLVEQLERMRQQDRARSALLRAAYGRMAEVYEAWGDSAAAQRYSQALTSKVDWWLQR